MSVENIFVISLITFLIVVVLAIAQRRVAPLVISTAVLATTVVTAATGRLDGFARALDVDRAVLVVIALAIALLAFAFFPADEHRR